MENGTGKWKAEEKIAGGGKVLEALRELIIYPFIYSYKSKKLGLKWPRGLLLHGPPGTGKTSMVRAVVREYDAHLTMINPFHVHKSHAGESEKFLREAFAEAYSHASSGKPSVIFIDEIDAICPRRNNRREHETRIVGQLLTLMDGSKSSSKALPHIVVEAFRFTCERPSASGSTFVYLSTILGREKAIVVSLEKIRCIIRADDVFLMYSLEDCVFHYESELCQRLQMMKDQSEDLPFEFKVLELALEETPTSLDAHVTELETEIYPLLDELVSFINTANLERVRKLKSRLLALTHRVQKV